MPTNAHGEPRAYCPRFPANGPPPRGAFSAERETLAGKGVHAMARFAFQPIEPNGPPSVPRGISCTVSPRMVISLKKKVKREWNSGTQQRNTETPENLQQKHSLAAVFHNRAGTLAPSKRFAVQGYKPCVTGRASVTGSVGHA